MEPTVKTGTYRHFKGGIYEVIGAGRHSETEEWLVVYKNHAGDIWVRPYDMFFSFVIHDNAQVQRFTLISEANTEEAIVAERTVGGIT